MIDKLDVNGKIVLDFNGQRVQEEKEYDKLEFGKVKIYASFRKSKW